MPLALGTDTSGSVRVPAAFCGVVGYKASDHCSRWPGSGRCPSTLDSLGILARTTADLLLLAAALGVPSVGAGAVRLVVPEGDEVVEGCRAGRARAGSRSEVRRLERLDGVSWSDVRCRCCGEAQELMDEHGTIVAADAFERYGQLLDDPATPGPGHRPPAASRRVTVGTVGVVRSRMPSLRSRVARELEGALLLCPTVRHGPPTIREVTASADAFDRLNASTLATTMLLSYLGMPGVSLPSGRGRSAGYGLLVSGPRGIRRAACCTRRPSWTTAAQFDRGAPSRRRQPNMAAEANQTGTTTSRTRNANGSAAWASCCTVQSSALLRHFGYVEAVADQVALRLERDALHPLHALRQLEAAGELGAGLRPPGVEGAQQGGVSAVVRVEAVVDPVHRVEPLVREPADRSQADEVDPRPRAAGRVAELHPGLRERLLGLPEERDPGRRGGGVNRPVELVEEVLDEPDVAAGEGEVVAGLGLARLHVDRVRVGSGHDRNSLERLPHLHEGRCELPLHLGSSSVNQLCMSSVSQLPGTAHALPIVEKPASLPPMLITTRPGTNPSSF